MPPTCPQDYSCTFTLLHPRIVQHGYGPWYDSSLGIVLMAILAAVVLALVAWMVSAIWAEHNERVQQQDLAEERKLERAQALALEEQRTLQADMAKGDPEMLKLIRSK